MLVSNFCTIHWFHRWSENRNSTLQLDSELTTQSYAKSAVCFLRFNAWHWPSLGTGTFELSMTTTIHSLVILPLFHCLVFVPWFCSCHIFLKPFLRILHFIVLYVFQDSVLSNIFHKTFIPNTLLQYLSYLVFFVAIYVNVVICLPFS